MIEEEEVYRMRGSRMRGGGREVYRMRGGTE
jgi:hypothetical protein